MGRKTADTFKKCLSNRLNVVISSIENYRQNEGFISFNSFDKALINMKDRKDIENVYVIGGKILAESVINHPFLRGSYLTFIEHNYECDISLSSELINKLISPPFVITTNETMSYCNTLDNLVMTRYINTVYQNKEEIQYLDLLNKIIRDGNYRQTRNAMTYSLFGERLEFDLSNGFPLLTTKKMFIRGILEELIFFLQGKTDTKFLEDKKVMIWHGNTTTEFIKQCGKNLMEYDMGPMYGYQWRYFNAPYTGCHSDYKGKGIDQLEDVINKLIHDPYSRRILMTTYNPIQVEEGVLYPCHGLQVQFYVERDNRISLQMYQRSVDTILGLPFNIASYGALLHIIVNLVNNNKERTHVHDYTPGRVIMVLGDTHIYSDKKNDHISVAKKQLERKNKTYPFPEFKLLKQLRTLDDLNNLNVSDIEINNYIHNKKLKASMVI
jgi:dihydrofolate reductase/thymidylate synthase